MWACETGECLQTFPHRGPVRGIAWSENSRTFATISDPFVEHNATISIFDTESGSVAPIMEIDIPKEHNKRVNATNIWWTYLNEHLLVSFDNGIIRLYNPETGAIDDEIRAHDKKINRLQMNREKTLFITSSADFSAKLFDAVNLEHLKTYQTDRPVNDAVISETKDHILLGGGQEAMSVTTTSGKVGKFETRFFWLVYEEEFGCVKGHFGPINARKYRNMRRVPQVQSGAYYSLDTSHIVGLSRVFQWPSIPMDSTMPVERRMDMSDCTFSTSRIWI
jgi:translation initiation factor 3 subunit I